MSAKGKNPLVPRLRFAEFLNEEAWSERKLGEIGNFVSGGTPSTSNSKYWDGNIPWYTPKEIKNRMLKPSMRTISQDGLKKSSAKLLPKGAILITTRATIGDVAIANKECATNQGFQSLVVNETEVNLFWYYWILLHKNELIKRSSGSTFKEIRKTKIEVILTFSPKKKEQQKIAACLTALDDLISAATGRLDALKQHKRGLMQQLFPAEGETMPRLRFPEFLNEEAWSERKLGEIGNFVGGGTPSTSNPKYWDGNIQWYTPKEIKNRMLKPSMRTISKDGLKNSSAKLLPKGTILITARATIGDVAIANKECATNQGFQSLVVNETEVNLFWYYWILLHKNELIKRSSGSTFKEIRKTKIEVILTFSPKKKEQQKIAACLTALDDLIAAHTQKIAKLKTHKCGLMQQLFPAVDEAHR